VKRHSTDLLALLFGLAFIGTGIGFVVHETTGRRLDPTWVSAIGFLGLGALALALTLFRGRHGPEPEDT